MKFLLYGLNFSPELVGIGKYTGELAQELVRQGHQVTVVTAPPYYPQWRVLPGYSNRRVMVENSGSLTVIRCPLWVPGRVSGMKRILHLLSFALSSAPVVRREARKKPDLIFSVAPAILAAPAAARAGKRFGVRTWLHIQDFEFDAAKKLGFVSIRFRSQNEYESYILKSFDCVSSISGKMVAKLVEKGVPQSRTAYFPNWIDTSEIRPLPGLSAYRAELGIPAGSVVVLYSGSMGAKQGLEVLVEAARLLQGNPSVQFVICGEGPSRAGLVQSAQGLSNVRFLPLQPAERLNDLLNLADIHVLPQRANAADLVMPSKLLGMLASARPVIAGCLPGSELYSAVSRVGVPVQPEEAQALAVAVSALASNSEERSRLGQSGREFVEVNYSKQVVISRFIAEAQNLVESERGEHS